MANDAAPTPLRLIASAAGDGQATAVQRWKGRLPFAPLRFRLELFQIWIGFCHAALAAIVFSVPYFALAPAIFVVCAIMLFAAMFKLLIAGAYEGQIASAYLILGLQAALGSAAIIALPLLSVASPATMLGLYFVLEAAAAAYLAGAGGAHRRIWLPQVWICAALGVVSLLWQHAMPFWAFGLFVSLDLFVTGTSYTRAGVAALIANPSARLETASD